MVSPVHVDEQKPEGTSALSPMKVKQVSPVPEKIQPWRRPLRVVAGIVVSLLGGMACMYLTLIPAGFYFGWIVAFFVGIVCAAFLRSRWAILVVPLALTLGEVLVSPQLFAVSFTSLGSFMLVFAGPIIATLGSLSSISIVKEYQEQGFITMPTDI